jgi:hypothetical protein
MMFRAIILGLFVGCCSPLTGQCSQPTSNGTIELHVSPKGSKQANGSRQKPFGTIAEAQQAARKLIAKGLEKNLVVTIHEGEYLLTEPLRFDLRDSGTAQYSVTYRGAEGETALLSGGRKITGPWKKEGDGVWSLELPEVAAGDLWFRDLWRNDRRQLYNNEEKWDTYSWILVISNPSTAADASRVKTEGHFALDKASGKLFVNAGSDDVTKSEWMAGGLPTLVEIAGEKENKATNFHLENLAMRYTGWTLPAWGYPGLWGGVYKGENFPKDGPDEAKSWKAIDAAIEVEFCDGVTLTGLRLEHLGGMGIALGRGVENSVIQGCLIGDVASTGIYEGWQGNAPRKAVDGWSGHVGRPSRVGPKIPNLDIQWGEPNIYPKNNRIVDNYLHDLGASYDAMGILCNGVWNPRVEHNYVARTSYVTICINDCTGDSMETKVLRNNHLVQAQTGVRGKGLHDGAPVYTSNSNVPLLIEGNYVRDGVGDVGNLHGQSKAAFYPDEGAFGTRIHNNVVDGGQVLYYMNNCEGLDIGDNIVGPTIEQRNRAIASTGPREPFRSRLGLSVIPVAFASSSWVINGSDKHPPILAFDGNPKSGWRSGPLGKTNLAAGKTVTASSGASPEKVVDEDKGTFWKPDSYEPGQWLQIDLGQEQTLRQVSLRWNGRGSNPETDNGRGGPRKYWIIHTSTDGTTWTEVFKGNDDEARHDCAFHPRSARWVRVQIDEGETRFFEIAEIRVYGLPENTEEWLAYDFGEPVKINDMEILWGRRHATQYALQVSNDGRNWKQIQRKTNGDGGREKVSAPSFTTRYLKLELQKSSADSTEGAYEVNEIIFNQK